MARVLVVEDNRANMKLASLLLHTAGHEVLCAVDAETGLTLARAEQPDLILMDIQLPGMDGLAATALLKKDPETAMIPVIALTAMAMKSDQQKSHVAGCDAYIAKPLRYQELYAAIDALLGKEVRPAESEVAPVPVGNGKGFLPRPPEASPRKGPLILVAEDNETNQKLILQQLALLGFAADVASNGRLALQRWQRGHYALLLSDLHMPDMDGYELTAAIRAQERGARRIPIVGLTASPIRDGNDHGGAAGMDEYLSKPLQLAELKAVLTTWLPSAASAPDGDGEAIHPVNAARPVDISVLKKLVGNDPAVVSDLLEDFRASASVTATRLTTACTARRALQVGEQAHKLMSSARAVGALALGELCAEMEKAGKAGNMETLETLLPLFEQEFAAVDAFLGALQTRDTTG